MRGWRAALDLIAILNPTEMRRNNHRDSDYQNKQEKTTGENKMIRKLFSRVFKAGTNPNNYSQHGRNAAIWHQDGPLITPRSYDYQRSLDYIRDLELTYRMLY